MLSSAGIAAVAGRIYPDRVTLLRYGLTPFYIDARRMMRLSGLTVDEYLAYGAAASIDGGDVTFTALDGRVFHAKVRVLGRRRAARWVNQFNERLGR